MTESQTVGKVYFDVPSGGSGECSASSVNSPKGRLVMTAGHCVVDANQDMGIAIMNNNAGQTIVNVVGGNGMRWNWGYQNFITILGYPADPPFDGESQYYCQGTTWHGHGQQVRAWCNMTGGSSGGPWLQDYSSTTGLGFINSVVSHRHSNPDQMDGPYFADNIKSLFDYAEDLT